MTALLETDLPFLKRSGKVRDVYDLGGDALAIVATDRISAFDCIMPNGIPGKGAILTALVRWWFEKIEHEFAHHLLFGSDPGIPPELASRTMLCRKTDVVPIECVARGYLAGSGWKEYQQSQSVCGVLLPAGLHNGDKLPEPIFTPATKADQGHDENIPFDRMVEIIGGELAEDLRARTLRLYTMAEDFAKDQGVIIADTKFEFGTLPSGETILIDEVLTPDSSRFWPLDEWSPGGEQPSFDKQYVRNWLEDQPWDKTPPAPALPDDVIEGTQQRYLKAYELLAGESFDMTA
ncbi:MAG: phosphoribosylaminoimidazolesuccinocarboxamide synthase [Planctomycetota bacterium]